MKKKKVIKVIGQRLTKMFKKIHVSHFTCFTESLCSTPQPSLPTIFGIDHSMTCVLNFGTCTKTTVAPYAMDDEEVLLYDEPTIHIAIVNDSHFFTIDSNEIHEWDLCKTNQEHQHCKAQH